MSNEMIMYFYLTKGQCPKAQRQEGEFCPQITQIYTDY